MYRNGIIAPLSATLVASTGNEAVVGVGRVRFLSAEASPAKFSGREGPLVPIEVDSAVALHFLEEPVEHIKNTEYDVRSTETRYSEFARPQKASLIGFWTVRVSRALSTYVRT